jgi:predicted Zn finger-like uncharacterized protein
MKKNIKCDGCGAEYNLDLDKYGGKKIKCKKCQGVIVVPTTAEADDEFEVVEEAAPATTPVAAPQSILHRHRTSSQSGAVNIALLQRSEGSRDEIRNNFLAIHGTEESRIQGITSLEQERDGLNQRNAEVRTRLQLLNGGGERALELAQEITGQSMEQDDDWLAGAVGFLGKAMSAISPEAQLGRIQKEKDKQKLYHEKQKGMTLLEKMKYKMSDEAREDLLAGAKEHREGKQPDIDAQHAAKNAEREAKVQAEQDAQSAVVQKAIDIVGQQNTNLETQLAEINGKIEAMKSQLVGGSQQKLQAAETMIANGQLPEAVSVVQPLLKEAPVDLVPQVLVTLSKCSFGAGNPTDAARHIQDGICFGAASPAEMGPDYNNLWAKAAAGLPNS